MAYLNFTDALMEAKRRGQLMGRPLTSQESAGIAEGYASSASERLARAKALGLQEQQLSQQKSQFESSMGLATDQYLNQLAAAEGAKSDQETQNLISNIGFGGLIAKEVLPESVKGKVGDVISSAAGAMKDLFAGLFEGGVTSATAGLSASIPISYGLVGGEVGAAGAAGAGATGAAATIGSIIPPLAAAAGAAYLIANAAGWNPNKGYFYSDDPNTRLIGGH